MSKDNKNIIGYYIASPITEEQGCRFSVIGYRGVMGGLGNATSLRLALEDIGTAVHEEESMNHACAVQVALIKNARKQRAVLQADIDCLRDAFQQICDNRNLPAPQLAELAIRLADEHAASEWRV
ncbi:hypothetical protein [Komagataeibacter sp. FNDCF1]|uniref:hypothetical protein n=1 Tax=Komagataeibacter sp. FNDCF1 TaxID=2878681 RepID=UPI001E54E9AF|nr:hypothetical protein [Komagataeibacter sp. FNDCF1]MCE2563746.1 hypothetical protein [Komagataeibacter sp. FNDCF1]